MKVRCSKCKGRAAVYLAYGNENLCKKHFVESFEKRVRRTVREFRMIEDNDRVGVAISGGKNGISMLYILKDICDSMRVPLSALSVDEGIDGHRERTLSVVKEKCKKLGVEHKVLSFRKEIGITIEEIARKKDRMEACSYCRIFKRWILDKTAKEIGLNKLAVGYNLDDAVQAVLMNFIRNEPFGFAKFGPGGGVVEHDFFVDRIKPLIRIPGREVAIYSIIKGENTKFEVCPYANEAFKDEVRVFLDESEEEFPGTKFRVFNSFFGLRDVLEERLHTERTALKCSNCRELNK